MRDTTAELKTWLENGGRTIGQITISPAPSGWELRHSEDAGRDDLEVHSRWQDARSLANLDDSGRYRALKTSPTLRHGWRMELASVDDLRHALDYFYPAMLGVWLAQAAGKLEPVCLRDTLNRQTGMYRITQKLTDEQAQFLVGHVCNPSSCIKTMLWQIAPGTPAATLPVEKFTHAPAETAWPLLCHEACNILVATARKVVKGEPLAQ